LQEDDECRESKEMVVCQEGAKEEASCRKVVGSWKREMVDNLLTGIVEIPDDKLQVVFVGKL